MVKLSIGSGVGGSSPTAGSEIGSSQLGKTEDHGVWRSMGVVQTTDKNQCVKSRGTELGLGWRGRIPGMGATVVHFIS